MDEAKNRISRFVKDNLIVDYSLKPKFKPSKCSLEPKLFFVKSSYFESEHDLNPSQQVATFQLLLSQNSIGPSPFLFAHYMTCIISDFQYKRRAAKK